MSSLDSPTADTVPSELGLVPPPIPPDAPDAWYASDVRDQRELHPGVVATIRETDDGFRYDVRTPALGSSDENALVRVREYFTTANLRRPLTREGAVERVEKGFEPKYRRAIDRLTDLSNSARRRVEYHALAELLCLDRLTPLALDDQIEVADAAGDHLVVHTKDYAPADTDLPADADYLARFASERSREGDLRRDALTRFVDDVGTPLADQTIGLVTGTLDVGGDTETVFETLQVEIGRLYHQKKSLRSNMLVYVVVGWMTALLVVGIMIAVNVYVLDSFSQLSAVSSSNAVQPARDRQRFYVVTQTTMLACGWFAGYASRGFYEALLHSAALVGVAYFVFAGVGMV